MSPKSPRRWPVVVALPLLVGTAALASTPHQDWTRAAIDSLPVYVEDRLVGGKTEQLTAIADEVAAVSASAPRPPREWAAVLLTVGYHESTFSLRIQRGECKPHECDRGRARSGWQLHRNLFTAPVWDQLHGLQHTPIQVKAADGALRRAYWTCARSGVPWLTGTLNAYAGKRCGAQWAGLDERIATWGRLVRVATPKAVGS